MVLFYNIYNNNDATRDACTALPTADENEVRLVMSFVSEIELLSCALNPSLTANLTNSLYYMQFLACVRCSPAEFEEFLLQEWSKGLTRGPSTHPGRLQLSDSRTPREEGKGGWCDGSKSRPQGLPAPLNGCH